MSIFGGHLKTAAQKAFDLSTKSKVPLRADTDLLAHLPDSDWSLRVHTQLMSRRSTTRLPSGELVDVTHTRSAREQLTVLVYPFIGGTTRLFEIPYQRLDNAGISILEFHPPAHGRSTGQMTMANALEVFRHVLQHVSTKIVGVGHSAGANALLHHFTTAQAPAALYLIQPVFSFRESLEYQYMNGFFDDFINAIAKWVTDRSRLEALLSDGKWMERTIWQERSLRNEIDSFSTGIKLGEFLEDFYLGDHPSGQLLPSFANIATVYVGDYDHW